MSSGTANGRKARGPRPASVVLVDDHPMWLQTVREVIEAANAGSVVAEARTGAEAVAAALRIRPDIVVMDLHLPEGDGTTATRELVEALPEVRILVLSASDDPIDVIEAMRAGARGYLLKTAEPSDVVDAIRRVQRGELVVPPEVAGVVIRELRFPGHEPALRVVVADGSVSFRDGVARRLVDAGLDIVATVGTQPELLRVMRQRAADVAVVDEGLPGSAGIVGLTDAIRAVRRETRIIVVVEEAIPPSAHAVMAGGAAGLGYLSRSLAADAAQLVGAIQRLAAGEAVVDPAIAAGLIHASGEQDALQVLTPRERDVLALMAEGRSNQAISEQLVVSAKAVEGHVRNIFRKLGLEPAPDDHRRVLAVLAYLRSG